MLALALWNQLILDNNNYLIKTLAEQLNQKFLKSSTSVLLLDIINLLKKKNINLTSLDKINSIERVQQLQNQLQNDARQWPYNYNIHLTQDEFLSLKNSEKHPAIIVASYQKIQVLAAYLKAIIVLIKKADLFTFISEVTILSIKGIYLEKFGEGLKYNPSKAVPNLEERERKVAEKLQRVQKIEKLQLYHVPGQDIQATPIVKDTLVKFTNAAQIFISDILLIVFEFLTPLEVLILTRVDKTFNYITKTPAVWNYLALKYPAIKAAPEKLIEYTDYLDHYLATALGINWIEADTKSYKNLRAIDIYQAVGINTDNLLKNLIQYERHILKYLDTKKSIPSLHIKQLNKSNSSIATVNQFMHGVVLRYLLNQLNQNLAALKLNEQADKAAFWKKIAINASARIKTVDAAIKELRYEGKEPGPIQTSLPDFAPIPSDVPILPSTSQTIAINAINHRQDLSIAVKGLIKEYNALLSTPSSLSSSARNLIQRVAPISLYSLTYLQRLGYIVQGITLCLTGLLAAVLDTSFYMSIQLIEEGIDLIKKGIHYSKAPNSVSFFKQPPVVQQTIEEELLMTKNVLETEEELPTKKYVLEAEEELPMTKYVLQAVYL